MVQITKDEMLMMDKIKRLNLINSCTGYKSANLIGTKSVDDIENVAVFSSITHLGSKPAMLGFIVRPTTVPRDTYKNIKETGFFTVNHISADIIADAHQTSAGYDDKTSEFDVTNLEAEYKTGINFPFVKNAPVQLLCKYLNEYHIVENDTIHIIASIENVFYNENMENSDGWLQLDKADVVAINGLDGYCLPRLIDRFEYARVGVPIKSFLK